MTDESQDEADRNDRANTSTPNKYATLPPAH